MFVFRLIERFLHFLPPAFRHLIQRIFSSIQSGLRLVQLQNGVEAITLSLLLRTYHFLRLRERFEELHAQAVDELELEGVFEQKISVVAQLERPRNDSAAAEQKILAIVAGTSFKGCRQGILVIGTTN